VQSPAQFLSSVGRDRFTPTPRSGRARRRKMILIPNPDLWIDPTRREEAEKIRPLPHPHGFLANT
jgi:hypothetical protein